MCGIIGVYEYKEVSKKKSVTKRKSAKTKVSGGKRGVKKRVAKKVVAKKVGGKKHVAKNTPAKKKGMNRAMRNGMYTYSTPIGVVAQDYGIRSPGPPSMKLGDFLKQKRFYVLAKMLGE